jgi:hypothetical protein
MIKFSNLENKEKNKNQVLIKAKVSNRFLFWHQDTIEGVTVFRINSRTITRGNLWLSGYRVPLGEVIIAYALGPSVLTN